MGGRDSRSSLQMLKGGNHDVLLNRAKYLADSLPELRIAFGLLSRLMDGAGDDDPVVAVLNYNFG